MYCFASVSSAKAELDDLVNVTRLLEDKAATNRQIGQDINNSLNQLRDRIQQARAQAKSVSDKYTENILK